MRQYKKHMDEHTSGIGVESLQATKKLYDRMLVGIEVECDYAIR